MAARWAAHEAFHKAVVARHRSYRKAKRHESKSGERSSSASKGGARAQSESEAHTLSESADEWIRFRRAADEAAAAPSSQAKTPGSKKGKGSKGSAGLKDSKCSASAVAKAGSAKGSKRKGKDAGLAEKPQWDASFKIPKRSLPDTSVSSGSQTPRKTDKFKHPGTIPYPLTLSVLSELVAWCSFEAPDTILCCRLRQSVKLGVRRIKNSGCGTRNSSNMSAATWIR